MSPTPDKGAPGHRGAPPRLDDRPLFCRECRYWYGAEDDEYGPCQIKHGRAANDFLTHGGHSCDEGMTKGKDKL
ncbi:MAG: hypothetical protein HY556_07550 [Euryarchaeota archaeon]|nr:hypothetical protein [Euryarchaeota archaeon]